MKLAKIWEKQAEKNSTCKALRQALAEEAVAAARSAGSGGENRDDTKGENGVWVGLVKKSATNWLIFYHDLY